MKLKDILMPALFALAATWLIQYFFFPKRTVADTQRTGSEFIAPASTHVAEPLHLEVNFASGQTNIPTKITHVETSELIFDFSTNGGSIQKLAYKRFMSGHEQVLTTINPGPVPEQEAFLVALNGLDTTPYYYTFMGQATHDAITSVTYKAETEKALITKVFKLHDAKYKVDLELTITPKTQEPLTARVLFPAPFINDPVTADTVMGVTYSDRNTFVKKPVTDVALRGWELPAFFGAEDRYFAHILVSDPQKFTQRAYFKPEGANSLIALLESAPIKEKTTWTLSFYVGPKQSEAFAQVDKKLDQLLDYGWLAPLAKPLLYMLKLLYSFLKNYGLAIIALTLLIKLVMAPLTLQGEKAAKQSAEIQRKMQYLEQKYKHDPETLAREKAALMRQQGVAILGCLPLLLQIPIFIGLNRVLSSSVELYKAPFFGWITDLSAKDPYYVLPILVGLGMVIQTSQTGNAKQRLSNGLLALVITGVTANISAGLALFIATSYWASILQTRIQKALHL